MATKQNPSDLLKNRRAIFEKSLALSLGLFLLVFLSWQNIELKAYESKETDPPIIVIETPETEHPKQEAPSERPKVFIETEEEDLPPEVKIVRTDLNPDGTLGDPPPPPEVTPIVDFWSLEEKPKLIHYSPPYYPELAQKAGLECDVVVHILVDEEGNPAKVKVIKPCGKAGFNEAAEEAAWKCKFTPGEQNDKPVRVWVSIPFRFRLR